MAVATALHERLFTALNATERHHVEFPFGAGHMMGTTAMGNDPHTSVTDAFGRSHDIRNLYVAGVVAVPHGRHRQPDPDPGGAGAAHGRPAAEGSAVPAGRLRQRQHGGVLGDKHTAPVLE